MCDKIYIIYNHKNCKEEKREKKKKLFEKFIENTQIKIVNYFIDKIFNLLRFTKECMLQREYAFLMHSLKYSRKKMLKP